MSSTQGIRAVVFDVDGVLAHLRFPVVLPETLGISPAAANLFFRGVFVDCLLGRVSIESALPPFLEEWQWRRSLNDFLDFWFETDGQFDEKTLSAVDSLRSHGIRCFIGSTQENLRANYLERKLGVGTRFEAGFFSCRIGYMKPDIRFFDAVSSSIGLLPHQLLLLDDQDKNVSGAINAGWSAATYRIGDDLGALLSHFDLPPRGEPT